MTRLTDAEEDSKLRVLPPVERKACSPRPSTIQWEERTCEICNETFKASIFKNQKYCSRACAQKAQHNKYRSSNPLSQLALRGIKLSTSTKGALSELKVAIDLIEKGYEVFKAVSPGTSCDYAIWKDGKLLRLEVKSRFYGCSGVMSKNPPHKADILALVYPDNLITYTPDLP